MRQNINKSVSNYNHFFFLLGRKKYEVFPGKTLTLYSIYYSKNYRFPFRSANKPITSGPDKTTKANTVNCNSISKFI